MGMRFLAFILMLSVAVAAVAAPVDKAKVDALAKPLIEDGLIVGCAVGVIKDGKAQTFFYGETEKGSKRTPDADTVYEIGSVTKVFTGILLADMVRRGDVKLSDTIQSLLPADKVTIPKRGGKEITLVQIVTHHSALARMPSNFKPADPGNPYADYSVAQMYEFLKGYELPRDPGELYEYSNLATGLLGHALALKAKSDFETLVIERICKPLKMSDTRITLNESMRKRLAPPYRAGLAADRNWDLPTLAGAGAIRSTVSDMLKFLAANVDGVPGNEALTKSLFAAQEEQRKIPGGMAIALGWHIARDGKSRWHNGQTGGYHSYVVIHREQKLAVVVLCNTAAAQVDQLGEQVIQLAAGIDVKPQPRRTVVEVDEATLKKFVGTYTMTPAFALTVTLESGKLLVQATGQPKIEVFAESKTKFFYKVVDAQITFVEGKGGKIEKLILHQNGRDMEAVRK